MRPALAKVSGPRIGTWLPRERLFRRIDECRRNHDVVWVSAPPGSGKTYLAASYMMSRGCPAFWYCLDAGDADAGSFFYHLRTAAGQPGAEYEELPLLAPEYLPALPTFARNFFRDLFDGLPRPGLIVFDDYQEVPAGGMLDSLLSVAIAEVPGDLTIVVLSRSEPPASLARERLHGNLAVIGAKELQLARREMAALARHAGMSNLDASGLNRVAKATHGWFAGVVLMLNRHAAIGPSKLDLSTDDRAMVFDYFATELFDRSDHSMRAFLLKTAFLHPLTAEGASVLTGAPDAGDRLAWLAQNHYFTVCVDGEECTYRYHPLFAEFLRSRARTTWSEAEHAAVAGRSAEQSLAAGYLHEGFGLLRDTAQWDALAEQLRAHARALVEQGRHRSLFHWISVLPDDYIECDPWIRFWRGMAWLFTEPKEAHADLVRAYGQFREVGDFAGCYTAWVGVVNSLLLALNEFRAVDDWLEEFHRLRRESPQYPSVAVQCEATVAVFSAKVHRCELHQDIEEWGEQALRLSRAVGNVSLRVQVLFFRGFHEIVLLSLPRFEATLEELDRLAREQDLRPIDHLRIALMRAMYYNAELDYARCRRTVEDGVQLGRDTGVVVLEMMLLGQLAWQAGLSGDRAGLSAALERMSPHLDTASDWDHALYWHLTSELRHLEGNAEQAAALRIRNLELLERVGDSISFHLSVFEACLEELMNRRLEEAETYLERVVRFAEKGHARNLAQHCHIARALISLEREDEETLRASLEAAFAGDGAQWRYGFVIWRSGMLARACEAALRRGICNEGVRTFIRAYDVEPRSTALEVEEWPWPVHIYTLGRFSVVRQGVAIAFRTKAQRRPLELLRALIAHGGRGVGTPLLCETLWPDTDGDMAAQTLKVTLHRLRKLVGEDAIDLRDGALSLRADRCWVDVWALERRLTDVEARAARAESAPVDIEARMQEVMGLYQGPFLGREPETPAILQLREHLQARVMAAIRAAAGCLAHQRCCDRVRALYEQGLRIDDCCEELYRGLIGCHAANGDRGAALGVYARSQQALGARLGVRPSPATEALRRAIEPGGPREAALCPVCGRHQG